MHSSWWLGLTFTTSTFVCVCRMLSLRKTVLPKRCAMQPLYQLSPIMKEHSAVLSPLRRRTIEYIVELSIGMCGCVIGNTGSLCKHQLAASQHSAVRLPQVHTCTPAERAVNDEFFSLIGFTSRLIYFHFFVCMKLMIFVTIRMDRSVGNGYYRSVN